MECIQLTEHPRTQGKKERSPSTLPLTPNVMLFISEPPQGISPQRKKRGSKPAVLEHKYLRLNKKMTIFSSTIVMLLPGSYGLQEYF